jgi:hypothetical protein
MAEQSIVKLASVPMSAYSFRSLLFLRLVMRLFAQRESVSER